MDVSWKEQTIWEFELSGDVEIKTGPFGTQLHASDYLDQGTPVINVRNIGYGNIRQDKLEYIGPATLKRLSSHVLRVGDIVFGRKGAVDRHVLIKKKQENWCQGSDCLRVRILSNSISKQFVSYSLLSVAHLKWMMNQCSHGATMASLNQDIIRRIPLKLPPHHLQRKIASILSAYDDLIENNLRRIQILEEMSQNLYREWFVNFRFPGHEKVKFVDSPLGKIPEEWEGSTLNDQCVLIMGQSPKSQFYNSEGDGLPFHQGVTNFGARFPKDKEYCTVETRIAESGDILFSVRAPVGRINLANHKIVIGRGLSAIRHKQKAQWFTLRLLKETFKNEDMIGGGTIFKSVTKTDMQSIKMLAPDEYTLSQFQKAVAPVEELVNTLTVTNDNLRQTRDLLLPKLISGQLDVSDLDIEIPDDIA